MKKISRTLGVISIIVLAIGILFKLSHWQGASIIQNVGILGLLAFFVVYLLIGIKPLTTSLEKSVGVAGALTMCLILIAYLFKSMHWPGASILILILASSLTASSKSLVIRGSWVERAPICRSDKRAKYFLSPVRSKSRLNVLAAMPSTSDHTNTPI